MNVWVKFAGVFVIALMAFLVLGVLTNLDFLLAVALALGIAIGSLVRDRRKAQRRPN